MDFSTPDLRFGSAYKGAPSTFSELWDVTREGQVKIENANSLWRSLEDEVDARNDRIAKAGGPVLTNPLRDRATPTTAERRALKDVVEQGDGSVAWAQYQRLARYEEQLAELEKSKPELAEFIQSSKPPSLIVAERMHEIEKRRADAYEQRGMVSFNFPGQALVSGAVNIFRDPVGMAAIMGGSLAGQMSSPVDIAAMIAGNIATSPAKSLLKNAMRNAAANAGSQALLEPGVQATRGAVGLEAGFGHAFDNIAGAAGTGAALDVGIRAPVRAFNASRGVQGLGGVFRDAPQPEAPRPQPTPDAAPAAPADLSKFADPDLLRRLDEGDPTAMREIYDALPGEIKENDPDLRLAVAQAEIDHASPIKIEGVDEGDGINAFRQRILADLDPQEPHPRLPDPIPQARSALEPERGLRLYDEYAGELDRLMRASDAKLGAFDPRLVQRIDNAIEAGFGELIPIVEDAVKSIARGEADAAVANRFVANVLSLANEVGIDRLGAMADLHSGLADPMDMARAIRSMPDLIDSNTPMTESVRLARSLARLSETAFGMVERAEADPMLAQVVSDHVPNPMHHAGILADLKRAGITEPDAARRSIPDLLPFERTPDAMPLDRGSKIDDPAGREAREQTELLAAEYATEIAEAQATLVQRKAQFEAAKQAEAERAALIKRGEAVLAELEPMLGISPADWKVKTFAGMSDLPPDAAAKVIRGNAAAFKAAMIRLAGAKTDDAKLAATRNMEIARNKQAIDAFAQDGVIWIAAYAVNPEGKLAHEVVHALVESGRLTREEVRALADAARRVGLFDAEREALYRQTYEVRQGMTPERLAEMLDEEAAAHLIEAKKNADRMEKAAKPEAEPEAAKPEDARVEGILSRIQAFMGEIRAAITRAFGRGADADAKPPTIGDLMDAILSGEVAKREATVAMMRREDIKAMAVRPEAMFALRMDRVPVSPAERQKIATELRRILPAGVPVEFVDNLVGDRGAPAIYRTRERKILIDSALSADDMREFGNHEVIHALKSLGAFTDSEWKILVDDARRRLIGRDMHVIDGEGNRIHGPLMYRDLYTKEAAKSGQPMEVQKRAVDDALDQELVATLMEEVVAGTIVDARTTSLVARIKGIIEALRNYFKGLGYRVAADVIADIQRGTIGARAAARNEPMFSLADRDTGRDMRRVQDALGYYSKLDEVLGSLNPKDKVTLQTLTSKGVKLAEIEARGLGDLLDLAEPGAVMFRGLPGSYVKGSPLFTPTAESEGALFLAPTRRAAEDYAGRNGHVREVIVSYKKPFVWDVRKIDETFSAAKSIYPGFKSTSSDSWHGPDAPKFFDALRRAGFDAIELRGRGDGKVVEVGVLDHSMAREAKPAVPVSDLVETAGRNRVEVREVVRQGPDKSFDYDDGLPTGVPSPNSTKWSANSLDPSNPTYRETVLHLPEPERNYHVTSHPDKPDHWALQANDGTLFRREDGVVPAYPPDARSAAEANARSFSGTSLGAGFRSGHFPEPNIIGHLMTSMNLHQGKPVYTVDQIQSDWGQKLRDGGVRDEAKIAELKAKHETVQAELTALVDGFMAKAPEGDRIKNSRGDAQDRLSQMSATGDPVGLKFRELFGQANLLRAEYRTAEASSPGNPLVNTTDQWVNTTLRRALRQAAEADAEYIAIPSGDTVLSYNSGDDNGMRQFYGKPRATAERIADLRESLIEHEAEAHAASGKRHENALKRIEAIKQQIAVAEEQIEGIVPKNLRNILKKLDKTSPAPVKVAKLDAPSGARGWQDGTSNKFDKSQTGFTLFQLTPEVKRSVVNDGQVMFSFAGEKARTADLDALDRAKAMEVEGTDRTKIFTDTGWFRGVDGKWRFEIDDDELVIYGSFKSGRLDRMIDHDGLFNAYPGIARTRVDPLPSMFGMDMLMGGGYRPPEPKWFGLAMDAGHLTYSRQFTGLDRGAKVLHETQHAIQNQEGFADGGSSSSAASTLTDAEKRAIIDQQIRRIEEENPVHKSTDPNLQAKYNRTHDEYMIGVRRRAEKNVDYLAYKRLSGEVEARAVEKRMNLTAAERRARPPWLDYDVPENQQIVRFADGKSVSQLSYSEQPPVDGFPTIKGNIMFAFRAFHGTHADFDRFDISKIGTGEGAQVFGRGLYFTQSEGLARMYAKTVGRKNNKENATIELDGVPFTSLDSREHSRVLAEAEDAHKKTVAEIDIVQNAINAFVSRRQKEDAKWFGRGKPNSDEYFASRMLAYNDNNAREVVAKKNDPTSRTVEKVIGVPLKPAADAMSEELRLWRVHSETRTAARNEQRARVKSYWIGGDEVAEELGGFASWDDARKDLLRRAERSDSHVVEAITSFVAEFDEYYAAGRLKFTPPDSWANGIGRLYEVNIDADEGAFLLWDRPLSEQSPQVEAALDRGGRKALGANKPSVLARVLGRTGPERKTDQFVTSADSVGAFVRSKADQKQLREELLNLGIKGIKYLDRRSRQDGDGTFNYVVFDDTLIEIVAKDGKPIQKSERQSVIDGMTAKSEPMFSMAKDEPVTPGLDMSPEARKQRAEAMGFDTSKVYYHGTVQGFDSFKRNSFFTPNPEDAGHYARIRGRTYGEDGFLTDPDGARVVPVYIRGEIFRINEVGIPTSEAGAIKLGYDPQLHTGWASRRGSEIVVPDPVNIRSVNAAFDPANADSPNLMFSLADQSGDTPDQIGRLTARLGALSETAGQSIPDLPARVTAALNVLTTLREAGAERGIDIDGDGLPDGIVDLAQARAMAQITETLGPERAQQVAADLQTILKDAPTDPQELAARINEVLDQYAPEEQPKSPANDNVDLGPPTPLERDLYDIERFGQIVEMIGVCR